ncbi:DUF3068 domain-containing protein [soil metagenome]
MGKKVGIICLFLGAFLLTLAALSKFYMYDRLAVAPLDQNTTGTSTTAPGADATYLDVAAGVKIVTGPLKSVRVTIGNVKLSKEASKDLDEDVTVWDTFVQTDTPSFSFGSGATPLSGTKDRVAFDRNTGAAVDWSGTSSESDGVKTAGDFTGQYFKFPFDTQKKTHKFWDSNLLKSTDATYEGESTIKGLKVYKFVQTIEPTKTGVTDVPGALVGEEASTVSADLMYSTVRTLYIDPPTGVIIKGSESQNSYLAVNGEKRATTTEATLTYTDAYVKATVDEYKGKSKSLTLVKSTIPLVGLIGGLILIAAGAITFAGSLRKRVAPEEE